MFGRAVGFLLCAAPLTAQSAVIGTVYDSIARKPLVGAMAQLFGPLDAASPHTLSATTDSLGAFQIAHVPAGKYAAGFFHPAVDSLGLEIPGRTVEVGAGGARLDLAMPSPERLDALLCPSTPISDSTAVVIGHVRESDTERPIANAHIRVQWDEYRIERKGTFSSVVASAWSETSGPGWFALCGVPAMVPLSMRADDVTDTTGYVSVQLASHGLGHLTFHIAHIEHGPAASVNAASRSRVTGTVTDGAGQPIAAAQVGIWQTRNVVMTNEHGVFMLDNVMPGSQTIEVRAIGIAPVRRVAELSPGQTLRLDVAAQRAVVLDAIQTRAEVVYSKGLMDFQRHQRTAPGGYFVRPTEVGEHAGQDLIGLTRSAPNVVVNQGTDHRWQLLMTSPGAASAKTGGTRTCIPPIFLNGRKALMDFDDLVAAFPSDEILGLEIYNHLAEIPSDYQVNIATPCGAIALWTRPFDGKVRNPESTP